MKKILLFIATIVLGCCMVTAPVFAEECTQTQLDRGCVNTSILGNGCSCDDGTGNSILRILRLVADIMMIGVGIFAAIGIGIVGTQYLTAGGNEEKTKKAKRRLLEIVIGLFAYVVLYAALKFLLPDFTP